MELQLERESAAAEMQLAREKAGAEIELKRAIAEADLALEGKKLEMDEQKLTIESNLKGAELSMTKDHEMKKLDIEKEKLAISEKDKQQVKGEKEAQSFAPQFMKSFQEFLETQNKFNKDLITEFKKPKTITAKSSSGATLTATTH